MSKKLWTCKFVPEKLPVLLKRKLKHELNLYRYLKSPLVAHYDRKFVCNDFQHILFEHFPNGNLETVCNEREPFHELEVQCLLRQIVMILQFLQKRLVVHRDLRPANLMLTEERTLKICNFGNSAKLNTKDEKLFDLCGAEQFQAPEMLNSQGYSFAADVFAAGVLVY